MQQHNILMTANERKQLKHKAQTKSQTKSQTKPDIPSNVYLGTYSYFPITKNGDEQEHLYFPEADKTPKASIDSVIELREQITDNITIMEASLLDQIKNQDRTGALLEPAMRSIIRSRQQLLECLQDLESF